MNNKVMGLGIGLGIAIGGGIAINNQTVTVEACGVGDVEFTTTANLNLRIKPGTKNKSLGVISKGAKLCPFDSEEIDGQMWGKVKFANKTGWVSMKYMEAQHECAESPSVEAKAKIRLNIRKGAGTSTSVIGQLKKGQEVDILWYEKDGLWAKVQYGTHKFGYVSAKYLEYK